MTPTPRRLVAAVLATAVGGGVLVAAPATAHNPRETPKGAPRMDLEVMVTPEIEGRITPGGTDPVVSVDGFGNRFVVARKEDTQAVVGVDPRARTATRASAWAWTSADAGLTWQNLDVAPRGAEQLLPQSLSRDVTSGGPLTLIVENYGVSAVVHVIGAAGLGRLGSATSLSTTPVPGTVGGDVAVATNGRDALVVAAPQDGPSSFSAVPPTGTVTSTGPTLPGRCDVAADPRKGSRTFWAACVESGAIVLHESRDAGATFARRATAPAGSDRVQVDVGPDGVPYVLAGKRLLRLRAGRLLAQDLAVPRGDVAGLSFAVSGRGRIAASAYTRSAPGEGWHVQVALFPPGARPVWYDFADHDPATPSGASQPPSAATSVDTDPQGRLQVVWSSTFLHSTDLDRPLLRNVFTARSVTS